MSMTDTTTMSERGGPHGHSVRGHEQVHAKGPRPGSASRLCLAMGLWAGHTHPPGTVRGRKNPDNETEVDLLCLRLGAWGFSI